MSARIDLAEFLTAYLAEADEQATVAKGRLLAIEESHRKNEKNPRAVRDLFRSLHTIKGLSAMVGIEPVVGISHRMEAVLRAADRAGGDLAPAALQALIEGLAAIELRTRALSEQKAVPLPPASLLAKLESLESGDATGAAAPSLDLEPALSAKLAAFEKQQLFRALDEGKRAVQLEFVPSAKRAAAGETINVVRERIATLAEIVKVLPVSRTQGEGAPGGLAFVLLLVTSASDEELASSAGVEPTAVRLIGRKDPVRELSVAALPEIVESDADPELPEAQPERRNVLRVDVSRVDDAMEKLASLIVSRSRLTLAIASMTAASVDTRELRVIAADLGRQLRDLRASILSVRMVRVAETLERLRLVVRSLCRASGKQVRLEIDAGDAELDKAVAERIFPAVLHLIRNAVDHGIESPEERRAAGKPEEALVRVSALARSNTQLELLVSDDGRGVDGAHVAARLKAGVPSSEAALLELLCLPGFSTRDQATTTSGRGMGMDIVKRTVVDQLGGELLLSTQVGVGTVFALHVPLTIAIVDAFTTQCSTERFVVPVSAIEEILEMDRDHVGLSPITRSSSATHLGMFERRGEAVPLVDLASLLRLPAGHAAGRKALIVRRGGQPVAFVLDRVLGQQEAVVRPLADPLVNVPGVSGSTDLGDGRPTLVLDLVALAGLRAPKALHRAPAVPALPRGDA